MKNFFKNPCNIYFFFWCLYLLQGTLYPKGAVFAQILLFIILLTSLKHLFQIIILYKNDNLIYLKALNILVLMYTIYGIALFVTDGKMVYGDNIIVPSKNYLQSYLSSLLPIYSFYYYAKNEYLNIKLIQRWFFVFVGVAIADYYELQAEELRVLMEEGSEREEITNNAGYALLSLIPCLLVFDKKPILQYIGLGTCFIFIIMGMKRGAILIAAIALVIFVWYKLQSTSRNKKILVIIAVGLGLYFLVIFIQDLFLNSEYFQYRYEKTMNGDASQRGVLHPFFWDNFLYRANAVQMLFGYGANGTIKLTFNYAHNDWLEILTNQGLFGVIIFFYYWFAFFYSANFRNLSRESRFTLNLIIIMYFIKTFFSMSIGNMTIYTNCMIGLTLNDGLKGLTRRE